MPSAKMEAALATKRRARAALKRVADTQSTQFSNCASSFITAASNLIRVSLDGERIPQNRQCERDCRTDIGAEIDDIFKILVARNCRPFRAKLFQRNISAEERQQVLCSIESFIVQPLAAFYSLGDTFVMCLMTMVSNNRADFERRRMCSALIHVLMHISDCNRYLEMSDCAATVAQLMRCISPDDAEAHMRLGLCLPFIQTSTDNLLPSFFHFCVFLANRKVPIGHPEADVVHSTVSIASTRMEEWEHGKEMPMLELFSARFVCACWSVLTSELVSANEAASSDRLWSELRDLFRICKRYTSTEQPSAETADGSSIERDAMESTLLHIVGIAIFVRDRLTAKGGLGKPVCRDRAAVADELIRNLIMVMCEDAVRDLKELSGLLRKRKKNYIRQRQKRRSRKRKRNEDVADLSVPPVETGLAIFEAVVTPERIPVTLGPLSKLTHFWSKTIQPPRTEQKDGLVGILRELRLVVAALETIQTLTHITSHFARVKNTMVTLSQGDEIPMLSEDAFLYSLRPARDRGLLNKVNLQRVPLESLFGGVPDGILRRGIAQLEKKSYETLVRDAAQRHLQEFGQSIVKFVSESTSLTASAAGVLATLAIRAPRIARMVSQLNSFPLVRIAQV